MFDIILRDLTSYLLPLLLLNFLIGISSFPLVTFFFKHFKDRGYFIGHILGYLSLTFIYFFLVSLSSFIFQESNEFFTLNSAFTIVTSVTTWIFINLYFYKKYLPKFEIKKFIVYEAIFFSIICFYYYLNAFSPNIEVAGEKLMSLGFLNSLEIQKNLPLNDFWFAGMPLNYYYFGHIFGNLVLNLLNVKAIYGYFLIVILIPGIIIPSLYYLISKIIEDNFYNLKNYLRIIFSLLGILIFAFISPIKSILTLVDLFILKRTMGEIGNDIWDYSVRVIPNTIAENFNYGINFIPLHGHIFSLIITMVILYSIYSFFSLKEDYKPTNKYIVLFGLFLGLTAMTNTWDVIFHLGLFHFLFLNYRFKYVISEYKEYLKNSILMIWYILIVLFFWAYKFSSPGGMPGIVQDRSNFYQWIGLWGFFVVITILGSYFILRNPSKSNYKFIYLLTIYSFIISLFLEIFYFKDANSGGEWYRANTYYKFSNQAFLLLSITSTIFLIPIFTAPKKYITKTLVGMLIILCFVLNYFYHEIRSTDRNFSGIRDVTETLTEFDKEFYDGIKFMQKFNIKNSTILEGSGYAYDNYNFVSSYTGFPTVLGWHNHEMTWRNSRIFDFEISQRLNDVSEFYTGKDLETARNILYSYNVDYIILSISEEKIYPNLNKKKVLKLGDIVFQNNAMTIIKVQK